MANPILSEKAFDYGLRYENEDTMTINGAINKSIILTLILILSALTSVYFIAAKQAFHLLYPAVIGSSIGAFILALVMNFKKEMARVLSILYAVLEGVAVGCISLVFSSLYEGIVMQAVFYTFLDLFIMLFLFRFRIIKVNDKFRSIVTAATLCVGVVYLISFLLWIFGINLPFLHGSGPISIGISIVVVAIASFNLLLDFDFIEQAAYNNMPKYFEWYSAFGLLVTLVWIYLEILRLLSKIRSRD